MSDLPKFKLTDEHKKLYREKCAYWMNRLGLKDWDYLFTNLPSENISEIDTDNEAMMVTFNIPSEIEMCSEITNYTSEQLVERAAKHEMLELLIVPLWFLAYEGYEGKFRTLEDYQQRFDSETHRIIHRLMKELK